jgi:hypothetical protein
VIRARIGRRLAAAVVTPLVILQLLAGGAGAADTRLIYLGSGPVSDAGTNGVLTLTPVTVGGVTSTTVIVKNIDNQTLTHVVVTVPAPSGGLTMTGVFGADASSCGDGTSAPLVCDFGNLAKNQSRTFSVLFSASSTDASTVTATVQFNESTNPNGSNAHVEPATGSVTPTDGGCDSVATFLPPGQATKIVGTTCDLSSTNPQKTSVAVPGSIVSAIRVAEEASSLCKADLVCFGQASIADVAVDGTYTVVWTIEWQVPSNFNKNRFGILHFPDGSTTADLTLTFKKNLCKTDSQVGCIESLTLDGTTLTGVIRTSGNGSMRGFS